MCLTELVRACTDYLSTAPPGTLPPVTGPPPGMPPMPPRPGQAGPPGGPRGPPPGIEVSLSQRISRLANLPDFFGKLPNSRHRSRFPEMGWIFPTCTLRGENKINLAGYGKRKAKSTMYFPIGEVTVSTKYKISSICNPHVAIVLRCRYVVKSESFMSVARSQSALYSVPGKQPPV